MTEDDEKLDGWSDQNLIRYYTTVQYYPGKLGKDNIILERLVQRGLATGAGDTLKLTEAGNVMLTVMQTEAFNTEPILQARLEVALVDAEHWQRVAGWETDQLVAHFIAMQQKSPIIKLPKPLPHTRLGLIKLLAHLWKNKRD